MIKKTNLITLKITLVTFKLNLKKSESRLANFTYIVSFACYS